MAYYPAMVGGAALLADGILTPAVTVTTASRPPASIPAAHAIIGDNQHIVVMITIAILCTLFAFAEEGGYFYGKAAALSRRFWFLFLGAMGVMNTLLVSR